MKKLKLKKKVKVITTLLSFGMLLTVLPSMKLVAEDDASTDTSDISVGPYIKYEASEDNYYSDEVSNDSDFTTLEANGGIAVATDNSTGLVVKDDGSYIYDGSVTVDKTISEVKDSNGNSKGYYKLDLSASSLSKIEFSYTGVDYILMLDVSDSMAKKDEDDYDRISALKEAVTNFINQVAMRSPGSRIALISYANEAHVLTSQMSLSEDDSNEISNADESALVTVNDGKDYLINIVDGLSANDGEGSFSDYAMLDALKIFQDANNDEILDGVGQKYNQRTRVSVLFTAGLPGDGKETGEDAEKNSDSTGWKLNARDSAQATMSMATIMKFERGKEKVFSSSELGSNVAGGHKWDVLKSTYETLGLETTGCESTVYTVGLNLPSAVDPTSIKTKAQLEEFADMTYTVKPTGWGWNRSYAVTASGSLKMSTRQAALVNEFMYRVSSQRTTGEHYKLDNKDLETYFSDLYNKLGNNLADISSAYDYYGSSVTASGTYNLQNLYDSLYFLYPDCITRDLTKDTLGENYKGPYYLSATDKNLARLTDIFKSIAQQVGDVYDGLSVRDYIDSGFIPVNEKGEVLSENSKIGVTNTEKGTYQGILKKDTNGIWYIEWTDVKLSPKSSETSNDAKTFGESIYVKPVDGMIGGNNLTTNTSASGIYIGDENKYPFPQPTVDIPITYTLSTDDQNIYLTNTVNILDMIKNLPNGSNNKGVTMVYTVVDADGKEIGSYTILPGESSGIWNDGFDGTVTPDNDQNYKITCTITTSGTDTDHSSDNHNHHIHADVEYSSDKEANADINVFKPELTFKDLSAYYGDSKPDYSTAKDGDIVWNNKNTNISISSTGKYTEPGLNLYYDDNSGTVNTKSDYQVGVTVKVGDRAITNLSRFSRTKCNDKTDKEEELESNKNFIVHVNTCSLTITKEGGTSGETYFFTIKKKEKTDDSKEDYIDYTKVSITVGSDNNQVVIKELPVGDYQITEDDDTSWRYESKFDESSSAEVSLNKNNSSASVTCKNTKNNDKWLNKISSVAKNVYTKITTNE